ASERMPINLMDQPRNGSGGGIRADKLIRRPAIPAVRGCNVIRHHWYIKKPALVRPVLQSPEVWRCSAETAQRRVITSCPCYPCRPFHPGLAWPVRLSSEARRPWLRG